jgi:hypothetical protein
MDWLRLCVSGGRLTSGEASRLERELDADPEALNARVELIGYYYVTRNSEASQRHFSLVHWIISNHPEVDLQGFGSISAELAPEAYREGKRRWLVTLDQHPGRSDLIHHAADYLFQDDPTLTSMLARRGMELEPSSPYWHVTLARLATSALAAASSEIERVWLGREAIGEFEKGIGLEKIPVRKAQLSIELAEVACSVGQISLATQAVAGVLTAIKASQDDADLLHRFHIVMGHVALALNDVQLAREHLEAAGSVPASAVISSFGPDFTLASALLDRGERDSVLSYLECCKEIWTSKEGMLDAWKTDVESGVSPDFNSWTLGNR